MTRHRLQKYMLQPSPEISPEHVIKLQLKALGNNDSEDSGIEAAFVFASPENKAHTGPLERFIRMVKNPLYQPMLNHQSATFEPIRVIADRAQQRVILLTADNEAVCYIFTLSRQAGGPYRDCWMTDSVQRALILPIAEES